MIKLRRATNQDSTFTYQIKKAAIYEYVDQIWGWDETFQQQYHQEGFNPLETQIIIYSEKDVGWIEVRRNIDKITIVEIFLLPEYQNLGIGTFLLQKILSESEQKAIPVALGVFKVNIKAKRLYQRMGFEVVSETETHYLMEKRA